VTDPLELAEASFRDHFGHHPVRASVSFLGVEPIEVLRFEPIPDEWAYLTLGMSRRPMTAADAMVQAEDGPRAELMLHVRQSGGQFDDVWRQLAVLAAAPAVEGVVYVPDMTVDLGQPFAAGSRCVGGVITESVLDRVLQVVPATSTELAWSRVHGTAALRERWAEHHSDLLDLGRAAVPLG